VKGSNVSQTPLQVNELGTLEPSSAQGHLALLQVARRRKSLILLGVVVALVIGALYYAQCPPVYEARAELLVIRKRPEGVPGLDPTRGTSEDYLSTQAGILKSPLVVNRAIQEHDLRAVPGLHATGDLSADIIAHLKVGRDPKDIHNSILDLAFRSTNREGSNLVLSSVVEAYKEFLEENYRNVSDETVKLVTRVRDELEKDLIRKEESFRTFRRQTPVFLLRGQNGASFNGDQLLLIHSKQLDAQVRREEIEKRLDEIDRALKTGRSREELIAMVSQLMNKTAAMDSSGHLISSTIEEKLLPALLDEKMLLEDYGPNHPDVQAAHRKVELARTFVLETLKQELNDLKVSEQVLGKAFDDHAQAAKQTVDYDIQDEGYRADLLRVQQLYDLTIKRLQDADMVKDLGGFDAQAISPPTAKKVSPKAAVIFPVALALGLLLGFGGAYLAEVTDKTFRSADEIRQRLELPVVGHIPRIELKPEVLNVLAASGTALDPMVVSHHRPKSREAESYRGVRTSLYFGTRGSGHRVIQVTSPSAGDGKSTLAANLAVSIAQSGKRTLLIDADLRKPRVHKIFGLQAKAGLATLIAEGGDPAAAIHATEVPNLFLLPCGRLPSNPAELLTSPRFQELIDILRGHYDFVLIDTPPLLAVTDPCVVSPRVDGVLLTIRITRNGRPPAQRARDILQALGAPIFGVVVNGVAYRGVSYEGYGYSYYSRDYSYASADNGRYYENEADEANAGAGGDGLAAYPPAESDRDPHRNGNR
jgi:succinoglycan biosynthesis transport protein ExoP